MPTYTSKDMHRRRTNARPGAFSSAGDKHVFNLNPEHSNLKDPVAKPPVGEPETNLCGRRGSKRFPLLLKFIMLLLFGAFMFRLYTAFAPAQPIGTTGSSIGIKPSGVFHNVSDGKGNEPTKLVLQPVRERPSSSDEGKDDVKEKANEEHNGNGENQNAKKESGNDEESEEEESNDHGEEQEAAGEEEVQLPSVLLIGAQKCGTTAMADWLFNGGFRGAHVFEGEPDWYNKEPHFFDKDSRFNQGLEFYAKRFQNDTPNDDSSTRFDATPDTLPFAQRVRDTYSSAGGNQVNTVKLMVILRDPVDRELSLYNHLAFFARSLLSHTLDTSQLEDWTLDWIRQVIWPNGTIMSPDEFIYNVTMPALTASNPKVFPYTLYAIHLKKWFDLFSRQQILVLTYAELRTNPQKLQERVQKFLGQTIPGNLPRSNTSDSKHKVHVLSDEARQRVESFVHPHNERLYQLLESHPGPLMEQSPFPKFSPVSKMVPNNEEAIKDAAKKEEEVG